ncbi:FAD:protein FMN transferase [Nonomuraea sp. 3-1Str]|uniref:FAD:protein FMN transferase n=1 Tax=Nonomuraea sp. 3-1Str TaxID=2929801 RepID=UPI00285ED4FD|nr:FAD:protein FMN transferase [Nonomuraea sp. 3-1Str]MDR8407275.1 FAD:protein FMN transferase [Nonomuraea sp. 3-1Str]
MTAAAAPVTRHAEHVMGTVFSFDVRGDGDHRDGIGRAVAWLRHVDAVFSTYRPDSPVSRLGRGEIGLTSCPAEVAEVLALCARVERDSGGYFTAHPPGGRLDPSGLVKGWAIERASDLLTAAGLPRHSVNGGGDVQLGAEPEPGRPWRVGVAAPPTAAGRPADGALATVVAGAGLAVATSGTAERGHHIVDPHTGRPATALASITLAGPRLTTVDAYATAAFAMGEAARDWVEDMEDLEALAVTAAGQTWRTSGFHRHVPPEFRGFLPAWPPR